MQIWNFLNEHFVNRLPVLGCFVGVVPSLKLNNWNKYLYDIYNRQTAVVTYLVTEETVFNKQKTADCKSININ